MGSFLFAFGSVLPRFARWPTIALRSHKVHTGNNSLMESANTRDRLIREGHSMANASKRKVTKEAAALLDNPDVWREFLRRISGYDVDWDHAVITSFAEAIEVDPVVVWLKLKPTISPPTSTRH